MKVTRDRITEIVKELELDFLHYLEIKKCPNFNLKLKGKNTPYSSFIIQSVKVYFDNINVIEFGWEKKVFDELSKLGRINFKYFFITPFLENNSVSLVAVLEIL